MALEIGQKLADYTVDGFLGAGGMGDVYKVTNRLTGHEDAAKVLKPELTNDPAQLARFLQEIRTLARLKHDNIVALRTALTVGGQVMMVIEYVDGDSLDKIQASLVKLPDILDITKQLLRAFEYAHEKGVIHRDVKPQNIMVSQTGQTKLLDFGIANIVQERRLTPTGYLLGSPHYMAPEQINGVALDARTDLYSLGIVLYEMIAKTVPFDGTVYNIWQGHLHEQPKPPSDFMVIPTWLNNVILRALAKNPQQRFESAREMLDAVERGSSGRPAEPAVTLITPPPTPLMAGSQRELDDLKVKVSELERRLSQIHQNTHEEPVGPVKAKIYPAAKTLKNNGRSEHSTPTMKRGLMWLAYMALAVIIVIGLTYLSK